MVLSWVILVVGLAFVGLGALLIASGKPGRTLAGIYVTVILGGVVIAIAIIRLVFLRQ